MKDKPLVSVSIVTYQHVNYIKQCLDSVLIQKTTFPFEIVLGEDASTDGTREICIDYANKYPDIIRLFLRKREDVIYINGRPTGRYNFIENLKACQGKYIALCEGDDFWTDPLKLEKQFAVLEKNKECVFSFHKSYLIKGIQDYKTGDKFPNGVKKSILNAKEYLGLSSSATSSLFFKNIKLKVLDNLIHSHGDFLIYCELLSLGNSAYLDETMSIYRKHYGNLTSQIVSKEYMLNRIGELNKEYYYFDNIDVKKAVRKKMIERIAKYKAMYKGSSSKKVLKSLNKLAYGSLYYYKIRLQFYFNRAIKKVTTWR